MKIGFFGGGKMAEGILSAILANGIVANPRDVLVGEKVADRRGYLSGKYGVGVVDGVREVAGCCDFIFLAVRPQDVDAVAAEVAPLLSERVTLVSIVAGKRLDALKAAFGSAPRIVRVMPNLALRVGEGMCAVCGDGAAEVVRILSSAGRAVELDEAAFDAVTALSGSGPAYFAYMAKAMAAAGVRLGLAPDVALLLSEQTMLGTARFLRETGAELDGFIAGVCTKGGTTAAGMEKLAPSDFMDVVAETLAAAARRSRELA